MPRNRNKSNIRPLIIALAAAVLATLAGMVIIAALLMWLDLTDRQIRMLNQILKLSAIILGVCLAVRRGGEKGLATGVLLALGYMALGYGMYVALGGGNFSASGMLGEMLIGCAAGAVTGMIRANLPAKRH